MPQKPGLLILQRYKLIRIIGRGGAGEVWEALDTQTGRAIALKCFHQRSPSTMIRTELTMLRVYRLPGVVEIFDDFSWKGKQYLVMELVSGKPFPGQAIPVRWDELRQPTFDLLATLIRLHHEKIIHLDLKPDNVLVSDLGQTKLLDFGIAIDERMLIAEDSDQVFGTLPYIAPERLRLNAQTSTQADLYSVGIMLFRALTARLPYEYMKTTMYVERADELTSCPPIRSMNSTIPEFVARTIDALLSSNPEDRPASAEDALMMLSGQSIAIRQSHGRQRLCSALPAKLELPAPPIPTMQVLDEAKQAAFEARNFAAHGDLHRAVLRIHSSLMRLRKTPGIFTQKKSLAEETLLTAWVDIALSDGAPPVIALARHELARPRRETPRIVALQQLLQAVADFSAHPGNVALKALEEIEPFADLDVERRRQHRRALAARGCEPNEEDQVIQSIREWVDEHSDDVTRARYAFWFGFYQYRRGNYALAVEQYQQAVQLEPWRVERASVRIALASAEMELFRLDAAAMHANEALREAKQCRSPFVEARAEWIVRATMYRQGKHVDTDEELVNAVPRLRHPDIEALVGFTEATIAFRRGDLDKAYEWAMASHERWLHLRRQVPLHLAYALAMYVAPACVHGAKLIETLQWSLQQNDQGIGLQIAAMLGSAARRGDGSTLPFVSDILEKAWNDGVISALAKPIPKEHWNIRMDVLSLSECMLELSHLVPAIRQLWGSADMNHETLESLIIATGTSQ